MDFRDTFSKESHRFCGIEQLYRFHKPECGEDGRKHPLVLFLHGAGERGDDNELQLRIGIGTALELADLFVDTEYEGGRHQKRLDIITEIEKSQKN